MRPGDVSRKHPPISLLPHPSESRTRLSHLLAPVVHPVHLPRDRPLRPCVRERPHVEVRGVLELRVGPGAGAEAELGEDGLGHVGGHLARAVHVLHAAVPRPPERRERVGRHVPHREDRELAEAGGIEAAPEAAVDAHAPALVGQREAGADEGGHAGLEAEKREGSAASQVRKGSGKKGIPLRACIAVFRRAASVRSEFRACLALAPIAMTTASASTRVRVDRRTVFTCDPEARGGKNGHGGARARAREREDGS